MIAWLTSRIGRWVSAALVFAGVVLGAFMMGRREGRQTAKSDALEDSAKRQEKGREAVQDLRGASRDDILDRLRRNDGQW